jgi:hypothetical protein
MRSLAELEAVFDAPPAMPDEQAAALELLEASEEVLEHWVEARGEEPTTDTREGFRLLALHRQGAKGDPSFNACLTDRLYMMAMVSKHLYLFVSGKMQVAELGEFCCSAKPIRTAKNNDSTTLEEA